MKFRTWTAAMAALVSLTVGMTTGVSHAADIHAKAQTRVKAAAKVSSGFPLALTDEAGHKVVISKLPYRIASTTEGTDEILSALIPKKRLVMVTTFASQPAYSNIVSYVKGIPAINEVNAEQVLAVKPNLVLMASYNTPAIVKQIEQTGVPVFEFTNFNSVQDIENNILLVGRLVGVRNKAAGIVDAMNKQLAQIHKTTLHRNKPTVLEYGSDGYVAGSDTTVNSIIDEAGGINAARAISGWRTVTDEEVIKLNPQVIIDASSDAGMVKKVMSDPALASVAAVKNHRVYLINGAHLMAVSQYIVRGVRDVAHVLYPAVKLPADSQLQ